MQVPWFERMNLGSEYVSTPVLGGDLDRGAVHGARPMPACRATMISPVSTAARYSMPVPISGAEGVSSGTA